MLVFGVLIFAELHCLLILYKFQDSENVNGLRCWPEDLLVI